MYPAGFVHLFSALKSITGGNILPAQIVFGVLYIAMQFVVMTLYINARSFPPIGLCLLCVSRRLHSIFMLRLFNDCWAMLPAYVAVLALQKRRINVAIFLFSLAVSIKMNVLLFAPGVLAVAIKVSTVKDTLKGIVAGIILQIAVALPFLRYHPWSYLTRAFEFSRVFMYTWTVNWKFLPEEWFLSKKWAILLLLIHLRLLWSFVKHKWCAASGLFVLLMSSPIMLSLQYRFVEEGTVADALKSFAARKTIVQDVSQKKVNGVKNDAILSIVFISNFLGILCARSLHYQFYSWYDAMIY